MGWPGANGVPSLELDANPVLGQIVNLLLGNASSATAAAGILIGKRQTSTETPFDGSLMVNALVALAVPQLPPGGSAEPLSVPNDPILCGAILYAQLLHRDPAASAGIAFSRGLRIVVGR